MKTILYTAILAVIISNPLVAGAAVNAVPGGYEVSYDVNLPSGTSNGSDIQDVVILEWNNAGDSIIEPGFSIAGRGRTLVSHTISFEPDSALVLGWAAGVPGIGDEKDHLISLNNNAFTTAVTGLKWSEVFPGVPPEPRTGHNAMIGLLKAAGDGDPEALDAISTWVEREAQAAAFDPAGHFRVLEWSRPAPIDMSIPIPTMSFYGFGLLILCLMVVARRFIYLRS